MILELLQQLVKKILKDLLAYSSIGHIGYALAGLATGLMQDIKVNSLYFYLCSNEYWHFSVLFMKRKMNIMKILMIYQVFQKTSILSLSLLIILFSLAGIPPLAGFLQNFMYLSL